MANENEEKGAWDTETGLPNDIDAWIRNPSFGTKDEYAQAIAATGAEGGQMLLIDLEDESGEIVGSQGYSIGTGWIISDDKLSISHPKRRNVVGSSVYGQLQNRVVKELKVDMESRGLPTDAKSWEGLGFHWMQQPHATVGVKEGKKEATSLMPVEFLGEKKAITTPTPARRAARAVRATPVAAEGTTEKALGIIARTNDIAAFQEKALAMASVAANDALMAQVLDDGPEGFWSTHQNA